MLFHRDFLGYTGGHGKVWDYFNHALALGWDARVYLTPRSLRDSSNPWLAMPARIEQNWRPQQAQMLFVAGMDWSALPEASGARQPVLNLVQHVRHGDPALPLRGFLARPAWRICVSQAVAAAIKATGQVNGPVRVIPAALNLPPLPPPGAASGVFIGALKNPALGQALAAELRAREIVVTLADGWLPRPDYLAALARAQVVVPLPHATEGFFLPGLEAMALERPVVMPDCEGSAQYAIDGENCLMPPPEPAALAAAVERLLADPVLATALVAGGGRAAARHGLPAERDAFASVIQEMLT